MRSIIVCLLVFICVIPAAAQPSQRQILLGVDNAGSKWLMETDNPFGEHPDQAHPMSRDSGSKTLRLNSM